MGRFLTILISLCIIGGLLFLWTSRQIAPTTQTEKTFESKFLQFSITVPEKFTVKEELTYVDLLVSQDEKINVSRIGTNFFNLESYLKDFDSKRNARVTTESGQTINELKTVIRVEDFTGGPTEQQKIYYFFANNDRVYSLSTVSKKLYSDLDKIAHSFRYLGD